MMNERFELNEEMMVQVNGGRPQTCPYNPYSTNAPLTYMGEKKNEEAK